MPRSSAIRVEFTREHDTYLFKYLARHCPSKEGRSGRTVFQRLVANERSVWPWSAHHTWQSWRERYVKNADHFDALILKYQRKHNIKSTERSKRASEPTPDGILGPSAKRVKLGEEERIPSSEQHASSSSTNSKLTSKPSRKPQEAPSPAPCEPKLTNVRPSSPLRSSNGTNTEVTKKPSLDLSALQTRNDTLETSSPSPVPPPTDGEPEPRSSPRSVKRVKERPRAPSEVFASEPSSPRRDAAVDDVGDAPVIDTVHPRAPPRVVDSLYGQVLVDRKGHVPHVLPHREEEEEEEEKEKEKDKMQWPPPRDRSTKQRSANGPDVEVDAHQAFSQLQPQPRSKAPLESVATGEREREKSHHPFECVSEPLDRPAVVALSSAELGHGVAPQVENEQREDIIRDDAPPVKHIAPTAPLFDPIPNPASKTHKFPVPRASTRSPFRSDPPVTETHHPAHRQQSRTKAARHPALTRIRRQTIGHDRNGHQHENGRGRKHGQVPSIDLVALSRSSTSTRSHSRSSAGAPVPTRPSRWSFPAFACPMPWAIGAPEGAPSAPGSVLESGSGSPFRWVAPSLIRADTWGRARTSSLGGTSTPRFAFSSPARTTTAVATTNTSAPLLDAIPALTSLSIVPHPPDVPITASHGLASILAHMSTNHGLALGVVEAVYTRVGSLREADEVLKGMREAAEGFGVREIQRRTRGQHEARRTSGVGSGEGGEDGKEQRKTSLKYVVTSEDGEGSEYSPPETSRAAMWKQQSESVGYVEEGEGKEDTKDVQNKEEQEEGRAVEKELWEGENDGRNAPPETHHDFSQVLLGDTKGYELVKKMGRAQFHREIIRRLV